MRLDACVIVSCDPERSNATYNDLTHGVDPQAALACDGGDVPGPGAENRHSGGLKYKC